jgi:hypothetical protein
MASPLAVPKGTWVLAWNDERRHPGWQVTAFAAWREGDGMSASPPIRTNRWTESRVSPRWLRPVQRSTHHS